MFDYSVSLSHSTILSLSTCHFLSAQGTGSEGRKSEVDCWCEGRNAVSFKRAKRTNMCEGGRRPTASGNGLPQMACSRPLTYDSIIYGLASANAKIRSCDSVRFDEQGRSKRGDVCLSNSVQASQKGTDIMHKHGRIDMARSNNGCLLVSNGSSLRTCLAVTDCVAPSRRIYRGPAFRLCIRVLTSASAIPVAPGSA